MNILIVGLGSMGQRRIRLLKKFNAQFCITGVDSNADRIEAARQKFGMDAFRSLEEALIKKTYDVAFISSAPLSHAELIHKCLDHDMHVFTEINLIRNMYVENMNLAKMHQKVLFLSSTFLYRREIEYMKELMVKQVKKVNYMYHVGQYLPDWHPWESYKKFFVGEKQTNGCRELMAIEFPWIIDVFGRVKSIDVKKSKLSTLDIDYADNYCLMIEHESGNRGMIALDVVSRCAVRNLEVFGEDIYFVWDGTPRGLYVYNYTSREKELVTLYEEIEKEKEYSSSIIENAYYEEIRNFFGVISGKENSRYSFEKDDEILRMIDRIEFEN